MVPAQVTERDGTTPNPPLFGSLAFLLLSLPVGIAGFVFVVTTLSVGISTAIIWVGVPILALAMLMWRGGARLERQRVHGMLGTYIATPYRPVEGTVAQRWRTRTRDGATWKDMTYFLLMLPVGIAEFTLMVSFWATSLWLVAMPLYYGFLPDEWSPVIDDHPFLRVDTAFEALPWAAVGAILLAVTVALTKWLAGVHARFARALLGPSQRRLDAMAGGSITWSTPTASAADFRTHVYPGV